MTEIRPVAAEFSRFDHALVETSQHTSVPKTATSPIDGFLLRSTDTKANLRPAIPAEERPNTPNTSISGDA
ncbi:MAG: hypothetical protein KDA89_15535, partial [Planctomycetaceae bacterium]|nr:hypothetical protein [Planctomycetaceae bacterium]